MPAMWQRLTNPDILIYLDVSMEEAARREGLAKPSSWWVEGAGRAPGPRPPPLRSLRRYHRLIPQEVLERILMYLEDDNVQT